ncbi:MAG: 30S ribosomal protein S20 [Bacilli bacterium]
MANIKSQIKRNETNELAREKNNQEKAKARTAIKKVETLVAAGKKPEATEALKEAISFLDQLAQHGTISGNSCSRKKAHLQHVVAGLK